MPSKHSSTVLLDVNPGSPAVEPEPLPVEAGSDDPFRILILGDFSGRDHRPSLAARRPQRIDRDNFDDVLRSLETQAGLRLDQTTAVKLSFAALTDFEPDAIFKRCDLFREPAARAAAAPAQRRSSIEADVARITSGSLLDEIVEQNDVNHSPDKHSTESKNDLQSVIDQVVAPHLVQPEDRTAIERTHTGLMRAILHHPHFQALEAAWRALDIVARALDTDGQLALYILDVTRAELEVNLDDLPLGSQPWAVIAGNYSFDYSERDVELLTKLGALARRSGAPFIAEGAPPDDSSENPEWLALRSTASRSRKRRAVRSIATICGRIPHLLARC
jgi:type VI secretion system protein ImpC